MKCDQTRKRGGNSAVAEEEYIAGFISWLSLFDNCIQYNYENLLTLGRSFGVWCFLKTSSNHCDRN